MRGTYRIGGRRFLPLVMWLLVTILVTGCGSQDIEEETAGDEIVFDDDSVEDEEHGESETDEPAEEVEDDVPGSEEDEVKVQEVELLPELTEDEIAALQYVEKVIVDDYYGDQNECEAFVPIDSNVGDGYAFYYDHGIDFSLFVYSETSLSQLQEYMDDTLEYDRESWGRDSSAYSEPEFGDLIEVGENKYRIATVTKEDYYGTLYTVKKVYYLDYQGHGAGVIWDLEIDEAWADDVTDALIDEMARCYRLNLDEIKPNGEWLEGDAKRRVDEQDEYEPREDDIALEKVDGYRYLGLMMLSDYYEIIQCPVLVPMGRRTYTSETSARANMHGVSVSAGIETLYYGKEFLTKVQEKADLEYDEYNNKYQKDTDRYRNSHVGELQPLDDYDLARCLVIDYEELDFLTEEFIPRAKIFCFIAVQEEYYLEVEITFSFEEYDDATNTLLEELETAYGIDLSEYYYEKVK